MLVGTFVFAGQSSDAKGIELAKKDYLALIVSNYVYGFNDYETSVTATDKLVSIGIYYDSQLHSETEYYEIADYFRAKIPEILKQYSWAKEVAIEVNFYPEKRITQEYFRLLSNGSN